MRYFSGSRKSSVRYQPLMLALLPEGLCNSIVSYGGAGSLCVSTSLINTSGIFGAAGSFNAGEPFNAALGRQLVFLPQVSVGAFSFTITSEKPNPSVVGYQSSS